MSTKIYNLSQNSNPIPGPNFYYARDKDGKSTGRHTFTVVRGALGLGGIQARFKKLFQDLGREIGVGIRDSIKDLIPKIDLNPFSSIGQPRQSDSMASLNQQMRTLIADQRSGNTSLRKIENLELGWA